MLDSGVLACAPLCVCVCVCCQACLPVPAFLRLSGPVPTLAGSLPPLCCLFALFIACREDVVWGLQTLSPNALQLSRQWHEAGYAAARLLDVASPDLLERLPVTVR